MSIVTRYLKDGKILDTDRAKDSWEGSGGETLHLSAKDRYYSVRPRGIGEPHDSVEVLAAAEAARWLLMAGLDLPEDLAEFEEDLIE